MQHRLAQSIQQTMLWFDVFDYPLTKEELYKYLWKPPRLPYHEFVLQLERHLPDTITSTDGFYHRVGRQDTINCRQQQVRFIEKKIRIAKRAAKILRYIPFTKAMFVCNTVAGGYTNKDSDIDVFIIIKEKHLWFTRLLITMVLSLFRLRRTKTTIANKICLSFYITDHNLNLQTVAHEQDIYMMYWISQLIPIYDPDNIREDIFKKNTWAFNHIPHAKQPYTLISRYRVEHTKLSKTIKTIGEKIWGGGYGQFIEQQAKQLQQTRMILNKHSAQHQDNTNVVVNDHMLKFHENDRRLQYKQQWETACQS